MVQGEDEGDKIWRRRAKERMKVIKSGEDGLRRGYGDETWRRQVEER